MNLIARNDAGLSVAVTVEAWGKHNAALEVAALIGRVSCAEEQQSAVDAQKHLATLLKEAETSRKAVKEPVLIYGRAIDDAAKKFSDELRQEELRITRLISDFQALEMAKVRAAQAVENERLAALERERQLALKEAKSHEHLDAINAEFDTRTRDEAKPPVAPVRAEGQVVREEWQFEVTDVWALAAKHPECVKAPEPRRLEIKALLDAGVKVTGVKAWKGVTSAVRTKAA